MWLFICITIVAGYLLGNINGAIITSRLMHDDVRKHGSGNAGLTNFIRNYGAGRSLLVIALDSAKTVAGCVLGGLLLKNYLTFSEGAAIGGAAVILGHAFPAFLGFRGGKGILSGLFFAIVVDWRIALIILAVFAIAYLPTMYVSLGSVLASAAFGVAFGLLHMDSPVIIVCGAVVSLLAIFLHRANIVRLVTGKESKTNLFQRNAK